MNSADISELLLQLFMVIKLMTGYPLPPELPPVHVLSQSQMQEMVCAGPCAIRAYYIPGRGVFINESLDFRNDVVARSILIHELVHHVQELSGRFDAIADKCDRWYAKEVEAYRVQNAYLLNNSNTTHFMLDSIPEMCTGKSRD